MAVINGERKRNITLLVIKHIKGSSAANQSCLPTKYLSLAFRILLVEDWNLWNSEFKSDVLSRKQASYRFRKLSNIHFKKLHKRVGGVVERRIVINDLTAQTRVSQASLRASGPHACLQPRASG